MNNIKVLHPSEISLDDALGAPILERRKCKIAKCITILEGHNSGEYCHTHQNVINLINREKYVDKIDGKKSTRKE